MCLHRIKQTQPPVKQKKTAFLTIRYVNNFLDETPFTKMLNTSLVKDLFPVKNSNFVEPGISFSRDYIIRTTVLNYRQTIADQNFASFQCRCNNYQDKFINQHHQHIVTGDLSIVENQELRSILSKGLNYHDQKPPDKVSVLNAVKSGVDKYIQQVSSKVKYSI